MSAPTPDPVLEGAAALPAEAALLAQAANENFPVALAILGPRLREDLMALYGFARLVDDVGDEVDGDRLALLDRIEAELEQPRHPVMVRLAATRAARNLGSAPLRRLIEANRRDQRITDYATFAELWDYCMLSAAPVGELVLELFDVATPGRIALSDCVCAALQVIEHLQDVEEDRLRGRSYLGDFDAIGEARRLLGAGPPLVRSLRGRARLAVAGFLAGGRLALAELEGRPRTRAGALAAFARAVAGR